MTTSRRSFNTAVMPVDNYRFDYAAEVRAFYDTFPERRDDLFFLDLGGGFVEPPKEKGSFCAFMFNFASRNESLQNLAAHARAAGQSMTTNYGNDVFSYGCILLNPQGDRKGLPRLMGAGASPDLEAVFILDHEIGHQVCPQGMSRNGRRVDRNRGECVADAYAAIRHLQRFGNDPSFVLQLAQMRAVELVFRMDAGDHFTAPVLLKIAADAMTRDFSALTPAETCDLAFDYAVRYGLRPEECRQMSRTFAFLHGKLPKLAANDNVVASVFTSFTEPSVPPEAREWAAVARQAVLNGAVQCDGITVCMPDLDAADLLADKKAEVKTNGKAPRP